MMGLYDGGIGPLGWLLIGAFWAILLVLIVRLVSWLLPGNCELTTGPSGQSALEILDGRLAGGEIDLSDWEAQRAALMAPVDVSTGRSRDVR